MRQISIIFLMIAMIISSCTLSRMDRAEKKINKLLIKFPELMKKDTITVNGKTVDISIPEDIKPDSKIDSLLMILEICQGDKQTDTVRQYIIKEIEKRIYLNTQKEIHDTTITKDGFIFVFSSKNGMLDISIKTPDTKIEVNTFVIKGGPAVKKDIFYKYKFLAKVKAWATETWILIKDILACVGFLSILILIIAILWKIFK